MGFFDGNYPPGVTDAMIDHYAGDDIPRQCWNCINYDPGYEACTLTWNNLDPDYYNPDTDDREPTDTCEDWEWDEHADYDQFFGRDEE